jgi:phage repressor protein C with HTH and peptisase S24 domain
MDIRYALNIERELGFSHIWLMTGEGDARAAPLHGVRNAMPVRAAANDDAEFVEIQMVKLRLSAGITGFRTEPERRDGGTLGLRRSWIERHQLRPEHLIAILVKGESMEPSLYEDDIVVVNTLDTRPVDGAVYAFNYEGEAVVKRLTRDAGQWWLTSDNPDQRKYHRKLCKGAECLVIGRVVRKESDRI